jgi:hypothetical protein
MAVAALNTRVRRVHRKRTTGSRGALGQGSTILLRIA